MSTIIEGIAIDDNYQPLAGATVVAFSTDGYTEGSATTDSNGLFAISGLTNRKWGAKITSGEKGHLFAIAPSVLIEEHGDLSNINTDQHHSKSHLSNHHTGGDDSLSLDLIAGTIVGAGHGDQTGESLAIHSLDDLTPKNIDLLSDVDTTTDAPSLNEVLKWDGTNWVPGTAGDTTEFTFSIDSFTGSGVSGTKLIGSGEWKAIGAIQFDATYSNAPGGMTAEVALTGSATAWSGNLSMTPVTGPETNAEAVDYPSTRTGSLTFTLSQSEDASTATDVQAFSNTMRYGTNSLAQGNQTEASIEALSEVSGPNESRSQTVSNIATDAGKYLTFSYADALSDAKQVQRDSGNGFVTAAFASNATIVQADVQTGITNVANSASFSETFAAVTSLLTDLTNGTNDFKLLTNTTAVNYIYWGELAKASSYTEADVEGNTATEPGIVASNTMSSRSMTVNCGATEHTYIAYPTRLGALTSVLIGGFESIGDFNVDNTNLVVTNAAGFKEDYRVYVSVNPGFTDPTTMTVTI